MAIVRHGPHPNPTGNGFSRAITTIWSGLNANGLTRLNSGKVPGTAAEADLLHIKIVRPFSRV